MTKIEFDAEGQSFGRAVSKVAVLLRGKHLAAYTPNKLPNIEVMIKNLDQIKFTGTKMDQKKYFHYSGYHGGIKARSLAELWKTRPQEVFRKSVWKMLPKNKTRDKIIKNLKFA